MSMIVGSASPHALAEIAITPRAVRSHKGDPTEPGVNLPSETWKQLRELEGEEPVSTARRSKLPPEAFLG